ncbi:MAG: hypothetical protein ABIS50_05390 [Luteolibacter sp.]|uniref:hypothetical protein n=1 Tax=Luteolibacter sp. TaxID=1962973 RepID=UPI003262E9C8
MNVKSGFLIAASLSLIVVSCGTTKSTKPDSPKEEPKKAPVEGPKLVGRVASVPTEKKFILIQSYGTWEGETGQILTTRGPENRSANLKITGEKLGEFAAADIQSGLVEVGDAVYSQHVPKPVTTPTPPETPQLQEKPPAENVQKNN